MIQERVKTRLTVEQAGEQTETELSAGEQGGALQEDDLPELKDGVQESNPGLGKGGQHRDPTVPPLHSHKSSSSKQVLFLWLILTVGWGAMGAGGVWIYQKLTYIDENLNGISGRLESVEGRLHKTVNLASALETLHQRMQSLEEAGQQMQQRDASETVQLLTGLQTSVAALQQDLQKLKDQSASLPKGEEPMPSSQTLESQPLESPRLNQEGGPLILELALEKEVVSRNEVTLEKPSEGQRVTQERSIDKDTAQQINILVQHISKGIPFIFEPQQWKEILAPHLQETIAMLSHGQGLEPAAVQSSFKDILPRLLESGHSHAASQQGFWKKIMGKFFAVRRVGEGVPLDSFEGQVNILEHALKLQNWGKAHEVIAAFPARIQEILRPVQHSVDQLWQRQQVVQELQRIPIKES